MRRLLLLALVLPILGLTACGGHTDPATNVSSNSATLHATLSCKDGEEGIWGFMYRGANWPGAEVGPYAVPWQKEPQNATPHIYKCSSQYGGANGYLKPGTYHPAITVNNLQPDTKYYVEICGSLGLQFIDPNPLDPNDGWHPPQMGCWDKNGNFVKDDTFKAPTSNDTTFTTAPFPDSSGIAGNNAVPSFNVAPSPDPIETGEIGPLPVDSSGCFGDQACASGVGTKWFCTNHPIRMGKTIFAKWAIFRGTLNEQSYCWGTGHNRGQYLNYGNAFVTHDTTLYGETVVGVVYDDVVGSLGPQVQNGKLVMWRVLKFHTCNPPIGALPIHACFARHDYYLTLKIVDWTRTDNTNVYKTSWAFTG